MPFLSFLMEKKRNFLVHSGSSLIKELCPCNASSSEEEAGRWVRGHPQLHKSSRRAWLHEVLSHKLELTHLLFCHLKLVAAGPPQFAESSSSVNVMKWQFVEHPSAFAFTPVLSIIGVLPYPPSEKGCVDNLFQVTAPASPLNRTLESGLGPCCVPLCCFLVTWRFLPLFCKLVDGWEWCFPAPDVSFISAVPRAQ